MLSKPVPNVPVVQDLSEALGMSKVELEKCLKEAVALRTVIKISEKKDIFCRRQYKIFVSSAFPSLKSALTANLRLEILEIRAGLDGTL